MGAYRTKKRIETYSSLLGRLVLITTDGIVGDIEGMIARGRLGIVTALDDEGVLLASDDVDLRDEKAVYVPGDAPADVT